MSEQDFSQADALQLPLSAELVLERPAADVVTPGVVAADLVPTEALQPSALAPPALEPSALQPSTPGPQPFTEAVVVPGPDLPTVSAWKRMGQEIVAALQTLVSAAVYATLIVTFGF